MGDIISTEHSKRWCSGSQRYTWSSHLLVSLPVTEYLGNVSHWKASLWLRYGFRGHGNMAKPKRKHSVSNPTVDQIKCGPKMMSPCLEAFNNHRSKPITTLPLAGGLFLLGICSLAKGNGFGLFGTSKGASWQKHAGPNCMVNPVDTPLLYV